MKIEKINEDDYERIFLTSDIHGHYSMFEELLDKIKLTKKDLLIILGDSCDRGSKTYELYKKYYDLEKEGYNIKHLRGNHEDMLIKAMESGDNDHWYRNGGEKTQKSFYNNSENRDTLTFEEWLEREGIKSVKWFVEWLDRIPIMISGKKNLFVHAAFDTTKGEDEQEHRFLIWDRNDFWTNNKTGKAIYFGHTPSKDGRIKHYVNDVHCIDTGSYKNGVIACVELKTGKEIYIKDKENNFIITPVDAQQELTNRIINYWTEGDGIEFNKNRKEAFENTDLSDSVESAVAAIAEIEGKTPKVITTSAKIFPNTVSYDALGKEMVEDETPYLILFGTGWGLTNDIMDMSYKILEPVRGKTKYNHLSVRSAVSIILDRLLGEN